MYLNHVYVFSGLIALILSAMGTISLYTGINVFVNNTKSKSAHAMFGLFICVFIWNTGYAWMGLCYNSDFAYIARAIALAGIFLFLILANCYVAYLAKFSTKILLVLCVIYAIIAIPAYIKVIDKTTVTFSMTPWGYWFTSSLTIGRILQTICIFYTLFLFYFLLAYWNKHCVLKREKNIVKHFVSYGPIMISGAVLDTLLPSLFKTSALPGSAIASFIAAMVLFSVSEKYRALGISSANVSGYVFDEVNIPIIVFNWKNEIALFNRVAGDFLEETKDTLVGKSREDLFEKVEASNTVEPADKYRVRKNGIVCKLDANIIKDEWDDQIFELIFIQDMTNTEKALGLMDDARRYAEDASKAKSNFLANMSHEIRTPMNAIIGMSDLLSNKAELDDESRNMVENIKTAGNGLLGIINDILDVSKIEAGKYELIKSDYTLASMINDVTTICDVKFQESRVNFIVDVAEDLPETVYGDEAKVRQIIINIVGNAAKFTKVGSVTLKIRCKRLINNIRFYIDVIDTGIGIKQENIGKLFGSFNQVDTRRNRDVTGTGLGLALSKGLANMMHGDITVESEYNKGSVFHIVLEQGFVNDKTIGERVANSLNNKDYKNLDKKKTFEIVPKPGKKVLIVDDIHMNLMVAKGLMKPYQMDVDIAQSGPEAIEMVQKKDYDLVFMDHMMPGMDGVDTVHRIRELPDEKYRTLTIIALTANAISGTKEQLIAEGMQDYLAKPIERGQLRDILDKWL